MHHWWVGIFSMQEQYSNSEPEVASVFWQLENDNRSIMSPQHSNNKQFHMPQVNKTSILSHTWQVRGDGWTRFLQPEFLRSPNTKQRKYI